MAGYAFIARWLHTLANSLASPAENPRPWIPTRGSDPNVEVTATLPDWATGSFDGAGLNQGQKNALSNGAASGLRTPTPAQTGGLVSA